MAKRQIEFVLSYASPSEPNPGMQKLTASVDNETFITVWGFGTSEYVLDIAAQGEEMDGAYNPRKLFAQALGLPDTTLVFKSTEVGTPLAYAEPLTFIHFVMDVLDNA